MIVEFCGFLSENNLKRVEEKENDNYNKVTEVLECQQLHHISLDSFSVFPMDMLLDLLYSCSCIKKTY